MKHVCVLAAVGSLASVCAAGEIIGPWNIQDAPVSAVQIGSGWPEESGWLNVVNEPVTFSEAFSGFSIIDDGFANGLSGCTAEMTFGSPVANGPGDDFVVLDGRYSENSYEFRTGYDGFAAVKSLPASEFSYTGETRSYYYGGGGPYEASVMAHGVDLSDLGVPDGGTVTTVRVTGLDGQSDLLGIGSLVIPAPGAASVLALGALAGARRRR